MAFNGSGTFLINTAGQPVVSGTVISSTAFNALTADLATGLSTAITKDGQTTVTANIPMSTYKFTGLGVGSAATDSANLSQVQSTVTKLLNSVSGADTITATASPTLAAYAAGQMFYFVAAGDNTTSVTLNIDSLGAKAVTRDGSVALAAADIKSGEVIVVVYDGTRFQVVSQLNSAGDARFANVSIASSLYVGGVSTFVGNAGFSANVSIASALSVGGVAAITGATTIGGNLTLSGGTANGVAYLNGSKVLTSGTALVFDGTNLGVGGNPVSSYRAAVNGDFWQGNGSGTLIGQIKNSSGWYEVASSSNVLGVQLTSAATTPIRFLPEGSEAMRLTSTGLGIGTASPAYKLDVVGAINSSADIISQGNDARISLYRSAGINYFDWASGQSLYFSTQTSAGGAGRSTKMVLTDAGNLGIGTASPSSALVISGDYLNNKSDIQITNTNGGRTWRIGDGIGAITSSLVFWDGTAGAARMVLDSSGNLGIGTTSPGQKLHVAGGGNTYLATQRTAASTSALVMGSESGKNSIYSWTTPTGASGVPLGFTIGGTEVMNLDASANATIGGGTLATSATDGFLYVPTCAGTPTGTPTAKTGFAPIVVDTTNNKLYFYSTGVWRDAGP